MTKVNKNDLELTFEWVSTDIFRNEAYICLRTGKIYDVPDDMASVEIEEELPTDLDDSTKYVQIPNKHELDLGTHLVFDFTRQQIPEQYDTVHDIFRRKGAYRRFKGFLERHGKLHDWYAFSSSAESKALAEWCQRHGFELDDSTDV